MDFIPCKFKINDNKEHKEWGNKLDLHWCSIHIGKNVWYLWVLCDKLKMYVIKLRAINKTENS